MTTDLRDTSHILSGLGFSLNIDVREDALKSLQDRLKAAPIATQEALQAFVPKSDEFQQRVIDARGSTIRVVAPAGSGKTQTIINRVLSRIRGGAKPSSILVLTFDNSAANSLREKLAAELASLRAVGSSPDLGGLAIATLNAYGYGIIRDHFPTDYKKPPPDGGGRRILRDVRRALKERSPAHDAILPPNIQDRFFLDFFSLLKNELFDPRKLDGQAAADYMLTRPQASPFFAEAEPDAPTAQRVIEAVLWLYQAIDQVMAERGYMDFDDQKLRAYVGLRDNADLRKVIQSRLSEVVVDEFQDINRLDFELIQLVAERATLVVTGDDDQAIYGFRGCSPEYIINLQEHLGRPIESLELQINYRCPPNIVRHADQLIRNNTWRIPKEPIPHQSRPSEIKVVSSISAGLEARMIVDFIRRLLAEGSEIRHRDIAVLYRTNAQSLPLQIELVLNGIPFFVREEDNILQNEVLDRLLAILRTKLALNEDRIPSTEDAVRTVRGYFRWLDADEANRIRTVFAGSPTFLEAIRSEAFFEALPKARSSDLEASILDLVDAESLLEAIGFVARDFKGMSGMVGTLEDALDQRVPLGEIAEVAANYGGTIEGFIATMENALRQARRTNAGQDADGVALLTYFKSKGLQWHTVILTSCNEGLIPHWKAPLEEERRLFYVAMTRASANLLVSYLANALNQKVAPSRFLGESGLIDLKVNAESTEQLVSF